MLNEEENTGKPPKFSPEALEKVHAAGLKVLNIARDALNDAGYHVSAPGQADPGEFYLEIDGIDVAVKVEII